MARYAFHDLTLEVESVEEEIGAELRQLLTELSWERSDESAVAPALFLSVRLDGPCPSFPPMAREVLRTDEFRGLESGNDYYLTDGASTFHLDFGNRRGEARLASSFLRKPALLRRNFWIFGLLKLLRHSGVFSLHAAGVVGDDEKGVLLVAESGSGKSTLTIALVRQGWRYLSDDAVLLRFGKTGIEALALRRHFYVDSEAAREYADLPFGEERADRQGGRRRVVDIEAAYPAQRIGVCTPRLLVFPRVVPQQESTLVPIDLRDALRELVSQSGPQLFDRGTMAQHLATLAKLLRQTTAYELRAGLDVYRDPAAVTQLIADAEGDRVCLASS